LNVRTLFAAVAALVCMGCTASTMNIPDQAKAISEVSSAPDGREELGEITVKHGNGCGAYGSKGTREGAMAMLKAKAYNRRAKAIHVLEEKEPGMRGGGCFENEYIVTAMLYGDILPSALDALEDETKAEAKAKAKANEVTCQDNVSSDGHEWVDAKACERYAGYTKQFPDMAARALEERENMIRLRREEEADLALQNSREVSALLSSKDALTKQGACANGYTSPGVAVEMCFFEGLPNSLDDDGHARLRVAITSSVIDMAKPEDYRVTVTHQGKQIYQEFGPDFVPSVVSPDFVGAWRVKMKSKDWAPGAYTVDVVWRHDVDSKVRFNITYE
jgi:hypothetical protein